MADLAVVIPAYGSFSLTRRALAALEAHRDGLDLETIVVDDCGPGDAARHVAREFPRVRAIRNEQNLGFAGACNAGWRASTAPLVLFLNDDAFAHAGALRALLRAFADPAVTIAGARLLYPDGSLQHAGMVWWDSPIGPISRHAFWHLDRETPDALIERDYPAVTGAALVARRAFLERTGGFDELYRNGYEDLDLCLRAWCSGGRVRYVPHAVFTHFEGATMGHAGSDRNHRAFYQRWRAVAQRIPRYPLPALPATRIVTAGAPPQFPAVARQFADGLAQSLVPIVAEPGAAVVAVNSGSPDVIVATPADAAMATAMAQAAAREYWVASRAQERLLLDAGVPPERVVIVNPGLARHEIPADLPPAGATPTVALWADASRAPEALHPLLLGVVAAAGVVPSLRVTVFVERGADDAVAFVKSAVAAVPPRALAISVVPVVDATIVAPQRFLGVDAFVTGVPSDPFEAALLAAAAAGVPIVRLGPCDEFVDAATGWCVDATELPDAIVAACGPEGRARGREARAHVMRAFPRLLAMRKGGERLRALRGGVPSAAGCALDEAAARRLREAGGAIARRLERRPIGAPVAWSWDAACWAAETERLAMLAPSFDGVTIGVDLDDLVPAQRLLEHHRRRGERVALYPVRASTAEVMIAQVLRDAADVAARDALLATLARPDLTINGQSLDQIDRPTPEAAAAMTALFDAADRVVAETPAIAERFARWCGAPVRTAWFPPGGDGARAEGRRVAVDARSAYTNELAFVTAALDGLVEPGDVVTLDRDDASALRDAAIVVAPQRGQPAAAALALASGRRVVVPADAGYAESPNVATYAPTDAGGLRAAVLRIREVPA